MNLRSLAKNQEAAYLPQYLSEYPNDWSDFITYLDYCYKQDWVQQTEEERQTFLLGGRVRKGLLQIWGFVTMIMEDPARHPEIFKNLSSMVNKITSDYGSDSYLSSFAILNLSNAENVTNRHNDLTHNMYVQCVGSVTWKIYESTTSQDYVEYVLTPGDAIWVPAGVSHEVVAIEPRAAMTITFEGKDN